MCRISSTLRQPFCLTLIFIIICNLSTLCEERNLFSWNLFLRDLAFAIFLTVKWTIPVTGVYQGAKKLKQPGCTRPKVILLVVTLFFFACWLCVRVERG